MKISIIGAGNIGRAIAQGLSEGTMFQSSDIFCTVRSLASLQKIKQELPQFNASINNSEAVKNADIILIAPKPWRLKEVMEQIKDDLDPQKHILISVIAGVAFDQISSFLSKDLQASLPLFRVIPNTAISVKSSMTFISAYNATDSQVDVVSRIFNELGSAMLIEEHLMDAGTALASSGIAFAMRYIRASMEGGVELGFYPKEARDIVLNTVKGAVDLLLTHKSNPEAEIDKVTTPGGITIKGLNEMELSGFTSSVIRGLKASR